MRPAYAVAQIRAAEAAEMAALPAGALMDRAAAGLAAACSGLLGTTYGSRVVLLVGSGDNGGDALYAGARLARRGARVQALLLSPGRAHGAGLAALRQAGGRVLDASHPGLFGVLDDADLVVDGIVGIGGSGGLRADAAAAVTRAEAGRATIVAVDVPSGVDASTGEVEGAAVRADVTVTFGALKPGLLVDPGASHAGRLAVVDIGLGPRLPAPRVLSLDPADVAALLPPAVTESDKYRRGVLGIVAGSQTYTGAAVLATGGALRMGAGMVRFVGHAHPAELVRHHWPEAVVTVVDPGDSESVLDAGRVQAWAAGPGLGTGPEARRVLAALLDTDLSIVVDADGLTLLAAEPTLVRRRPAPTLLTPHAGELARLLDTDRRIVEARRLEHARRTAEWLGVTVLLKGSTTVVAEPAGQVCVNATGTPRLATAGTGDVLTGMCGTLLASGLSALDAGSVAAWLHGHAARLASRGAPITAYDVARTLPDAVRDVHRVTIPGGEAEPVG